MILKMGLVVAVTGAGLVMLPYVGVPVPQFVFAAGFLGILLGGGTAILWGMVCFALWVTQQEVEYRDRMGSAEVDEHLADACGDLFED